MQPGGSCSPFNIYNAILETIEMENVLIYLATLAMNHAIDRTQLPIKIRVKDDYYRKEKIGMETELACIHKNQLNKLND
jgi:hypothetical protein